MLKKTELFDFLESKYLEFNKQEFIEKDPISIPHQFSLKQDIEIAGFFAATLAWGQRTTIINNCNKLLEWMDRSPYQFISNHSEADLKPFTKFVHRTFNGVDCVFFIQSLKSLYAKYESLENAFIGEENADLGPCGSAIVRFRTEFFAENPGGRSEKHVSNPANGSSSKRLCMFLRWMVRSEGRVDFGIWKKLQPSQLECPLDVHSGRVARKLGLLDRSQNDWKAVLELGQNLRKFDKNDPIKYDFALFGLGVFEKF